VAEPSEFVRVGAAAEFPDGSARVVTVRGRRVAVFHAGGRLRAVQDACPHMGTSLALGRVERGTVTCAQHGWRFDLDTGESDRRSGACLRVYEVRIESGDVWLRAPLDEPDDPGSDDDWDLFRDPERYLR
jgi:nitrite reductase/ring-hydroxylating ferredoxin subunit